MHKDEALAQLRNAAWLKRPAVVRAFELLDGDKGKTKAVGGIVRNTILGDASGDVDLATMLLPAEVTARAEAAHIKAIPTGIEHGTVTLMIEGEAFEVTSLRKDVKTDGRHAEVQFGGDWESDAQRRDFTFNALYAGPDGKLSDPLGGLDDCLCKKVRYIGDAKTRNKEDFLRILRFYRFFAYYGSGRPDADGLKASVAQKSNLNQLSAERIWQEVKKLLSAPDPSRALLWMRTTGVLATILPEGEKWGIDAIHGLISAEQDLGWPPDPMLRLMSILPPMPEKLTTLGKRLRLSNAEIDRLQKWAMVAQIDPSDPDMNFKASLYWGDQAASVAALKLSLANMRQKAPESVEAMKKAAGYARLLQIATEWQRPEFPISGKDLMEAGTAPGPEMGDALKALEERWVRSGFSLTREQLLGA